ncbi:MAG: SDR family oxidoreductase [Candidatus Paceibacterota bacterium]|jgi:NAD(P)-dependent dehydrogenase (short-subunit alcohol dehydrogenase family)
MELKDKVALVTGAALGYKYGGPSIGGAIAIKLAAAGAKVVVVDLNRKAGQMTVDKIKESGGEAVFVKANVTKSKEVKAAVDFAVKKFGKLTTLVNCAASYQGKIFGTVVDTPEKDWQHVLDVNLNGYYRFAKYSIPQMLKNGGGTIVNISSDAAFLVVPEFSVYPVTKAAINGLTRVLAVDHAPLVRTNAICPGFVKIANSEGRRTPEELKKWWGSIQENYPLKRLCSVDEIAEAALFLSSDRSSYINGECIKVDGGYSISDTFDYAK